MDGGDANGVSDGVMELRDENGWRQISMEVGEDGLMQVELEEPSPLPLEGEEERNDADNIDADVRDIDLAVALRTFASPLRCMTVHARSPSEPCFGSIWSNLRRSNGMRRFPRLGYCFWTTQDRCDECGRPTCRMHGWICQKPNEIARRVRRYPSGPLYYDFLCVHCWPYDHVMYMGRSYGGRLNYGGSIVEMRGWTSEFRDIDPLSGLPWSVRERGNARALARDGIIDLTAGEVSQYSWSAAMSMNHF